MLQYMINCNLLLKNNQVPDLIFTGCTSVLKQTVFAFLCQKIVLN